MFIRLNDEKTGAVGVYNLDSIICVNEASRMLHFTDGKYTKLSPDVFDAFMKAFEKAHKIETLE